ncbi:MAG: glycerophosphodiester phosphodiesterase [Bacteroidales bacterium]
MVIRYTITLLSILAALLTSCTSQKHEGDNSETKILGHCGSGANYASDIEANSYASVKNGFEKLHGAEVDIQCSKDGTIWLYHDVDLPENEMGMLCIPNSTDSEIFELFAQDTTRSITKLEDILILINQMDKKPLLSLDVKGYFPNGCFERASAPNSYFEMLAENISYLLNKYNLYNNVMVETDYKYFLDLIRDSEPNIECYLLGYHDFNEKVDEALAKNYHGVSYRYSDENLDKQAIEAGQQKGLKVMLWAVYKEDDFRMVIDWKPDLVQIGNLELPNL